MRAHEYQHDQRSGDKLSNDCGICHTRNAHVEINHKYQIQDNVQKGRNQQEI